MNMLHVKLLAGLALLAAALPPAGAAGAPCGTDCSPADLEALVPPQCRGMALIPAGEFQFGGDYPASGRPLPPGLKNRFLPVTTVRMPAYHMDKCEVTRAPFEAYWETMTRKHYQYKDPSPQDSAASHPSRKVMEAFCGYLGKRLPTEEEWEKAARGGVSTLYYWGDEWPGRAEEFEQYQIKTVNRMRGPVGQKKPNPYGLYDMLGNMSEMTSSGVIKGGNREGAAFLSSPGFRMHPDLGPTVMPGWRCARSAAAKQPAKQLPRR